MNIDTSLKELKDTFADHEHLAPDADDVMASVQQRIARRRSGPARPLAIAASVAVVATTASGAVVLSRHSGHPATQPAHQAASGPHASPTGQSRSHTARPGRSSSGIAPLTMPYDLGWLPAGSVDYIARRINEGQMRSSSPLLFDGEYMLTVTAASDVLDIDVQQMPGGLGHTRFKSGPGTHVAINGRDGIESTHSGGPGGYEVYFTDAAGGLMYVNVDSDTEDSHGNATVSAARLTAIGRRVAAHIRFPGHAKVTPNFGLGDLPTGLRMRTFDVEGGTTSYLLYSSTGGSSAAFITSQVVSPSGTPGRAVQGHRTRHTDDHGYRTVYVLDADHGGSVRIDGELPLSELYEIADGLVLPK